MDRLIFTAMSGAKQVVQRQEIIAQNLANASTSGYRAATFAARAVPVGGAGTTRAFAQEGTMGADLTAGLLQRTGRELDVAVEGNAWLAVQGSDGREAYTRAGALQVDQSGLLRAPGGFVVMGDGGPIEIPQDTQVSIARDGTVSATPNTGSKNAVVTVGRIKLATLNPKEVVRGDDGLFRAADGNPVAADERARLVSGTLEGSNVNTVEAMVGMISAARQFEMQMRMITTADTNARSAAQLLSLGN
jgi:flagellar basal-body rod protein FlgF